MADISLESVVSSNISAIGYDPVTKTMRVQFTSGHTYDAIGPTQVDFESFKSSKSKGIHFGKFLKKAFVWSKIEKKGA
ncbi:MAG: KTSC domain-containing protein [bacterium]